MSSPTDDPDSLSEELVPAAGLAEPHTRPFDPKKHKANTRRNLAWASLLVLVLFYGVLLWKFLDGTLTMDELNRLIVAFSSLPTLTAVAFTFYFAAKS